MHTPPVRRGLILRTNRDWNGQLTAPKLDEISIYADGAGWDNVFFYHSANSYWQQQGNYDPASPEVVGYGQVFKDRVSDDMEPQKNYKCHMVGVDFFKDFDDYKRFLRECLNSTILEEVWDDDIKESK